MRYLLRKSILPSYRVHIGASLSTVHCTGVQHAAYSVVIVLHNPLNMRATLVRGLSSCVNQLHPWSVGASSLVTYLQLFPMALPGP